tara:strand:- start:81 stop:302 length:222 start_codon:yes stop_codon:yes gene_type:complete
MSTYLEQKQECQKYISAKYDRTKAFPSDWEADEIFNCICMQEKDNAVRAADLNTFVVAEIMTRFQAQAQLELT